MLLKVNPIEPEGDIIQQAAEVIRRGGLVAFPTETVYGLGADALNPEAVAGIFAAKERPPYDPIIVHVASLEELWRVARDLPPQAHDLIQTFWPGPLTLILPRAEALPAGVTAGLDTVAVRMPAHPVALALIRAAGTPIAAPSANLFGHTSPTTAQHVLDDLGERVDLILDGGPTPIGVESTVLDLSGEKPTILRPGGTSREALSLVLGEIALGPASSAPPSEGDEREGEDGLKSPGLLKRHYAPRAALLFFRGPPAETLVAMQARLDELLSAGRRVGLLIAYEDRGAFAGRPVVVEDLGRRDHLGHVAARLFAALRALDRQGVEVILARDFGATGLGLAIEDRLTKAAGGRVIEVSPAQG
ncbi:MAG: threonylcarbamoyl-AMP synthase [Chloroflexi bacterium]|nr:threonylcarbamoyl-AMP synthase [Chloroflexota bacterium]